MQRHEYSKGHAKRGEIAITQVTGNTLPAELLDPTLHVIKNGTIFLTVFPSLYHNLQIAAVFIMVFRCIKCGEHKGYCQYKRCDEHKKQNEIL